MWKAVIFNFIFVSNNFLIFLFFVSAFFEPTDMRIAAKPFSLPLELIKQIKFISPNIYELNAIAAHLKCTEFIENTELDVERLFEKRPNLLDDIKATTREISNYIDNTLVTLGANGILITTKNKTADAFFLDKQLNYIVPSSNNANVQHRFYDVEKLTKIVNVSGAGDSFNVGFISAMLNGEIAENICVSVGFETSKTAIQSSSAVPHAYFGKNHPCWQRKALYRNI